MGEARPLGLMAPREQSWLTLETEEQVLIEGRVKCRPGKIRDVGGSMFLLCVSC